MAIAVFFANGYEEIEALTVVDLTRRAGIETWMVSITDEKAVTGSHGISVSMDSRGKMLSSTEVADFIKDKQVMGSSEITFIIGGSNGLSKEVLDKSSLILSFGKITFPHQLFRVVLTEQIYRAFTIISGLPYHK